MLLKHALLKMMNLEMLDVEKLNKELEKDGLSNTVNIEFQKRY